MYEAMNSTNSKKAARIRKEIESAQQQRQSRKQSQIDRLQRELNTESYRRMINRFEQVFHSNLSEFVSQLKSDSDGRYHSHLENLCIRLDYNGYVSRSMKS